MPGRSLYQKDREILADAAGGQLRNGYGCLTPNRAA